MKFDEVGTYKIEYTATDGCGNSTTEDRLVTVTPPPVYGAIWDGSENPAWTRTDLAANFPDPSPAVANGTGSSPFDDIMPWSGMQIVEDAEAGTLVSIPKFYYKWTRDGSSMKLQISPSAQDGFYVSPAHADRGDGAGERDIVYVGRYHCVSDYKSTTGVAPLRSLTRDAFRQSIHGLGLDVWQSDFAMYWTIRMLYLVEYANWNSQASIGYGCGTGAVINNGSTDLMQYHTGTNAVSTDTYGEVQYRFIEGLWSNVFDWVDGIRFDGANMYVFNTPSDFDDTLGGVFVSYTAVGTGLAKTMSDTLLAESDGYEYALVPLPDIYATESTYICDKVDFETSNQGVPKCGGSYGFRNQEYGLFHFNRRSKGAIANTGSRLMKLPT